MNKAIERAFDMLHELRIYRGEYAINFSDHLDGLICGLFWAGVLDSDQYNALARLASSAYCRSGYPFPSMRNAGPCIPAHIAYERRKASAIEAKPPASKVVRGPYGWSVQPVKPQAVPGNESVQLQPVTARRELRLLCLLVKGRDGQARSLPVHTLRPMPPRVCSADANHRHALHRWCLEGDSSRVANNPGLCLRETHAKRSSAEVLERCGKYRQAGAIRTATRAVRTNGVSV